MKLGLALVGILTPTVYGAQSQSAFVGPSAASMVSVRRQQHIAVPAVGGQVWGAWCQTAATSRRQQHLLWAAAESKDETEEGTRIDSSRRPDPQNGLVKDRIRSDHRYGLISALYVEQVGRRLRMQARRSRRR